MPSLKLAQPTGKVMVVGSVCIDLVAYSKISPALGESIIGDDFKLVLGGKGSNQAIAAALAESQSTLVSCIGSDIFSSFARDTLQEFGVQTNFLKTVEGPTGIAHIRVGALGDNDIVIVPLANSKITENQIDDAFSAAPDTACVLLQLEIPWSLNKHAIDKAQSIGAQIILDPAPAMKLEDTAWKHIDIVTPNESEAKSLTGITVTDRNSALAAGKWFVDRGVGMAAITVGKDGVYCVTERGITHFPAPKVDALDTTAAGDAFAGYLGALLSQGAEIEDAISEAVVAASISVTKIGASTSLPHRAEVSGFKR
jgi:ribokinase